MDGNAKTVQSGVSIFTILQAAFIIMKVAGVIKWSWWMVFLPLWIEIGLVALIILVIAILYFVKG